MPSGAGYFPKLGGRAVREFVRACALSDYAELVRDMGGNPEALLCQQRIESHWLERGDAPLPFHSFVGLLNTSARSLDPTFGLRLSRRQGLRVLGPIALIGLSSATVGDAFRGMQAALDYHCPVARSSVDTQTDPRNPRITFDFEAPYSLARSQMYETGVGNIYHQLGLLTHKRAVPKAVLFRHAPSNSISIYEEFFQAPVLFEQEVNAVVIGSDALRYDVNPRHPKLQRLVAENFRRARTSPDVELVAQVRFLMRRLLASGACGIKSVARDLCLHERTLQRKLKQSGVTHEELRESVRAERAQELLLCSQLSVRQIALELGYREQSSFTHACERWFGLTPTAVRRRLSFDDIGADSP